MQRVGKDQPDGDAATESGDGPQGKLAAFGLEKGFHMPASPDGGGVQASVPPRWQSRILYVRGAHPFHLASEDKGKRA